MHAIITTDCGGCGAELSPRNVSGYCRKCFPAATQTGPDSPNWNGGTHVHRKLRAVRGRASDYACVDCGKQAAEWSWTHDTDKGNPENYKPRCRKCHCAYDGHGYSRAGAKHTQETLEKLSAAAKRRPRRKNGTLR